MVWIRTFSSPQRQPQPLPLQSWGKTQVLKQTLLIFSWLTFFLCWPVESTMAQVFDVVTWKETSSANQGVAASGTANGIGFDYVGPNWPPGVTSNGSFTGFSNFQHHNPPLATSDRIHIWDTGAFTFDQPISGTYVYMAQNPEALGTDLLDFGITPVVVSGDIFTDGTVFGTTSIDGGLVFLPDINSQTLSFSSPAGPPTPCVDVAFVPLPFTGTENIVTLLEEDFSGTPGADLTTKGWNKIHNTYQLSSTTIDVGNSGVQPFSGYTNYTKEAVVSSLGENEKLILEWSFEFGSTGDGWQRVGLNLANSTRSYGHSWNTQEDNGGYQTGGTYTGGSQFHVGVLPDTLTDYRIVLTDTTISNEWKPRSSSTWNIIAVNTGSFDAIDEVSIDSVNDNFNIDTISLKLKSLTPQPSLDATWSRDGAAAWDAGGSWNIFPDPPNTSDHSATFGNAISAPTTVVVDNHVSINALTFDHNVSYGLVGLGSINLYENSDVPAKAPVITVAAGDHQFVVVTNLHSDTTASVAPGSTLSFNHTLNLMGYSLTKTDAGTMSINNVLITGGGSVDFQAGTVSGSGAIVGDVHNGGSTLSPGNSPGTMAIHGDYVQSDVAALLMEIAGDTPGNEHDVLTVEGEASVDGVLAVVLSDGFQPTAGDSFDLLDFSSLSGTFDHLDFPKLTTGLAWDTTNLYLDGSVSVVPEPCGVVLLGLGLLISLGSRRRFVGMVI